MPRIFSQSIGVAGSSYTRFQHNLIHHEYQWCIENNQTVQDEKIEINTKDEFRS